MCSKTFQIVGNHESSKEKYQIFNQYCKSSESMTFLNEAIPVFNRCNNKDTKFMVANDPDSFNELSGLCHISIEGKFGEGVKKIADYILFE